MNVPVNKTESQALENFFWFLYTNSEIVGEAVIGHYKEVHHDYEALHKDMASVEEQVEEAEEEMQTLKEELQSLVDNISKMKKAEIKEELERLLF